MAPERGDFQRPLDEAVDWLQRTWDERLSTLRENMGKDIACLIDLLDMEFQEMRKAPIDHVGDGDFQEVGPALEGLGENLASVWHFNNDAKVWSFYDPTIAEGSTLTHLITGETYLLRVRSTVEVVLNNENRILICDAGGNSWNQIVW